MGAEFAFKFFLLYLLLVMCVDGKGGARDDSQSEGMHGEPVHVHDHPSSHMDHMDHSLLVFFTLNDLKVGRTMPVYFPKKDPSKSPRLLPREDANSIPFSYEKFPYLLQFFSFSNGSPQALAMEDTLRECILGSESRFKVVSTTYLTESSILLQNYTILEVPKEVPAPKMVACHTMPYPYAVFYCHSQETKNKVFMVSLIGENGDRVEALAVCHLDTSQWSRNHVSFKVLGIEPGSSDVCHFFPEDNLVYVPMPTMSNNLINVM
ncbi:hypothetical protein D5086_018461 [Populus alba]|uniref:Uncharacterized protein n=1 Tax=Populus alba TaxID=43335 RepID=A0ACC4BRF4_POPAL